MKKNIAVFFGGRSAEHDVSIITAHIPIIESLLAIGEYEVWPVYIAKDGTWYVDQVMNDLNYFKQANWQESLKKQKRVQLSFDQGLQFIWPGFKQTIVSIDIAFPSMHGTYGEDGSLMGLLRLANIPFVGCDLFASAVAMDKVLTKQVVAAEGVPVVPYVWFTQYDWNQDQKTWEEKISKLKYPLFVKPVHLGSSIGISKVKDSSQLLNAIEVAFHYDNKVLVEEGVENLIEVTLPIMGNEDLQLATVERPMNKTEFFDFNDKYLGGAGKGSGANNAYSEIPAQIEPALMNEVQRLGHKTFLTLGCSGIARIDFLIDSVAQKVYMNEVNTLPGSLYHHNWKKSGVSGVQLITKLIKLAQERFAANQNTTYSFNSSILQNAGGAKVSS